MSDTVYLVTSGAYSDYHVDLVCLDDATAYAVAGRLNAAHGITEPDSRNGFTVETCPMVSSPDVLRFRRTWSVRLFVDGEPGSTAWSITDWWLGDEPDRPEMFVHGPIEYHRRRSVAVHNAPSEAEAWAIARKALAELPDPPEPDPETTVQVCRADQSRWC